MENTFYMVYVEGEQTPTHRHGLIDTAINEAKRLTEKTGKKAYVLGTIKMVKVPEKFIVEDVNVAEFPF